MCGINFLLDRTGALGPQAAARMRAATAHRGPDGCRAAQFGKDGGAGTVYLGHNRLKIIDLSDEADQPFLSADGRYALIYNGEIYNWRELRAELEANGVRFRTQSDTEVLLWMLIREGRAALSALRGMFAFVFYDSHEQRALAGRDAAGLKPLFWAESAAGVAISSEIGGISASGVVPTAFDPIALDGFLQKRYVSPPTTFRQQIHELAPGGGLTIGHGQAVAQQELRLPLQAAPGSTSDPRPADYLMGVEARLQTSLKRHLTADVPVGLWLSGGVDSTLLLALAQENGYRLPCFSIALRAEEGSFGTADRQFARAAAKQYGAQYHAFEADDTLLLATDQALASLSQPIADSSVLLTWWLAQQTSQAVKAVLSGAGADEWFAGYNRHRAFAWYLRHQEWLRVVSPVLRATARALPTAHNLPGRKQLRLIQHLLARLRPTAFATFQQFSALDSRLVGLLQEAPTSSSLPDFELTERSLLDQDRHRYLPSDILALTDQTAMRHGLEVRTPYLDQDLTGYVGQLSAAELLRNGPKWILRELLNRRGGHAFTKRRKEGFGLPLTRWLKMPKYDWLFDPVRRKDHPLFAHFDYPRTQEYLTRFLTGHHDTGAEAWALLTLFRWYDLQKFA